MTATVNHNAKMDPDYVMSIPLSTYRSSLCERTLRVLDLIGSEPEYAGAADGNILSLLYTLIHSCQMRKVLQLGTHIGFSTVVLADALCKIDGTLLTVDVSGCHLDKARSFVRQAGLEQYVRFLLGSSLDKEVLSKIKSEVPYDLVFVDSSHSYEATLVELSYYWPCIRPSGYVALHDTGKAAVAFDPTGQGGVRRAVREWVKQREDCNHVFLEPPVWPNPSHP